MHYKRHHPRTVAAHGKSRGHWLSHWPRWHDIVFHTRPRRRKESALLKRIKDGIEPDSVAWPLNHKPHKYYW